MPPFLQLWKVHECRAVMQAGVIVQPLHVARLELHVQPQRMVIRQIIAFLLNRVQADNENEAPSEAA